MRFLRIPLKKRNNDKSKSKINTRVPLYKLFSYSDWLDRFLILIGTVCSLLSALSYPIIFMFFGRIANTFVHFESDKKMKTLTNHTAYNSTCLSKLYKRHVNFDDAISFTIKLYIIISFISLLTNYLAHVCFNTAGERQIKRIRHKLFISILRKDMAFFDKNTPGELNSIIINNIESIKLTIGFKFADFIALMGRGIACITYALITAWKFSIIYLALVPIIILSLNLMIRVIKKYTFKEFKAYESSGSVAQETLSSLRTVLAFGIHHKAIRSYEENLKEAERISLKKGYLKGFFESISNGLYNMCFGIGIIYGTYLARTDCLHYNPANLMPAFYCMITSTYAVGQAIPFFSDIAEAKGCSKTIFDIIDKKSLIDIENTKEETISNLKGDIEFENIHFSYPQRNDPKILNGINLKIPAGKTVAFCGSSGCGKSTLFCLLQRFYLPNEGRIRIDNKNIEDLNLIWLRSQMALVSQEPILFQTTIKENIRLGRLDATDDEIINAAKMANAHDFIMKTTNNYDSDVGERGTQLSGGQKQRIAIARALLRNPKILLLDEATSALDNESEKIVQQALDNAKIGRTTLVIAHRLSTIRNADLIVGFDKGLVKEIGTHEELMNLKGIYYNLVMSQTRNGNCDGKETKHMKKGSIEEINQVLSDFSDSSDSESENGIELKPTKSKTRCSFSKTNTLKSTKESISKNKKSRLHKKASKIFKYDRKVWEIQKPETFWIILGTVTQLISGAILPGVALLFAEIYTIFANPNYDEQLRDGLRMMGFILGMGFLNIICTFILNISFSKCGTRLTKRIRVMMFKSMLRQEISFHDIDQNRSSILLGQLAANPPFCKGLTSDKLGILAQGFSSVGFAIVVSFVINWKLAFVMLIFVPITFISGVISGNSSVKTNINGKSSEEEGGRLTAEVVENIKTIVSLGREYHFLKEFDYAFDKDHHKMLCRFHIQAISYSISNTVIFFVQMSAFSYGYYLIKNENLTVTGLFRIFASMTFSSMILGRVYALLPDQRRAKQAARTAFKIIDRKSKIDSMSEEGLKLTKVIGKIEFKNVNFEYINRPNVKILKNFNLLVKNGETNALVGPSGCGKSTTISLLLRFYDIQSGEILLDGYDIRKLNIQWLRSQIGLVSQEPVLYNYSIKENIINGDLSRNNEIKMSEIIEVCMQANIHYRIDSLPNKYETNVGNKGSQLSGGEKQRIAIARALIRKPKILLLDEATSALDNESEAVVQQALDNAKEGRTCIVIAHRLSTIQDANKITVVKAGQVVEEGSHSKLMTDKNGEYYKLQTQNKSLAN